MTMPPARTVRLTRDGAIVTVIIDREPKLNALDYATIDALLAAFDELEADDLVRAVILTGAGQRAFSAGAARAAEIGLVNHVVPADHLLADATVLAEHIIGHSAAAVTECLSAVTREINLPIDEALAVEASWFAFAASTGDVTAHLHRFLTRKHP